MLISLANYESTSLHALTMNYYLTLSLSCSYRLGLSCFEARIHSCYFGLCCPDAEWCQLYVIFLILVGFDFWIQLNWYPSHWKILKCRLRIWAYTLLKCLDSHWQFTGYWNILKCCCLLEGWISERWSMRYQYYSWMGTFYSTLIHQVKTWLS